MKLNKYESREYRHKKMERATKGSGLYVYRNHNKATLMLPKPLADGTKTISSGAEFQGDSYFMEMVRTNQIRLVRTLIQEQQTVQEEKLILDQPDTVTTEGKVEHVAVRPEVVKPLNETPCEQKKCNESQEVLLNEDPVDGVDFLG